MAYMRNATFPCRATTTERSARHHDGPRMSALETRSASIRTTSKFRRSRLRSRFLQVIHNEFLSALGRWFAFVKSER